jgi:outer membrane protein assembly factor BamB
MNYFKILRLSGIMLCLLLTSSCFHKNVMTDRADDIDSPIIYHGKEGDFLICRETIFQATSKSSRNGVTNISGHNDYRISSYDLETGKLSARIKLKGGDDGATILLGKTDGKIWLYSLDKDLGLHCRNPKTLEVLANQQQLSTNTQLGTITFAKPKWYELPQYFSFNWMVNKLMVTDMQGYVYYVNPLNDSVQKTSTKVGNGISVFSADNFSSQSKLDEKRKISFEGDNRKTLSINYQPDTKSNLSFLFGKLIAENDNEWLATERRVYIDSLKKNIKQLQDSLTMCEAVHMHVPNTSSSGPKEEEQEFDRMRRYSRFNSKLETDKSALQNAGYMNEQYFLSNEPMTFFVYYASNVTDTARAIISKVKMNADSSFAEAWKCNLNGFYFTPDKAVKLGAFETVFSKGDPNLRFQWFDIADDKLIIIAQLQIACIDAKTGKLLWSIND